ncbi:MAG: hypothetical protein HKN01_00325, partial [Acidimicrobiia bacterium]|nr:hypothetical protein [Acidimicrobiia bacterium]
MMRAAVLAIVVVLVGCSSGAGSGTTEVVTSTTDAVTTTTSAVTTTTETDPSDISEPWDLVWFSDSTGWGVADLWGERIGEEFGVEVRVHDYATGNLSAVRVLQWIADEDATRPELRELLGDA